MTTKEYARRYVELEASNAELLKALREYMNEHGGRKIHSVEHASRRAVSTCKANAAIRHAESLA